MLLKNKLKFIMFSQAGLMWKVRQGAKPPELGTLIYFILDALALLVNIGLASKNLHVVNTIAYFEAVAVAKKNVYIIGTWAQCYK